MESLPVKQFWQDNPFLYPHVLMAPKMNGGQLFTDHECSLREFDDALFPALPQPWWFSLPPQCTTCKLWEEWWKEFGRMCFWNLPSENAYLSLVLWHQAQKTSLLSHVPSNKFSVMSLHKLCSQKLNSSRKPTWKHSTNVIFLLNMQWCNYYQYLLLYLTLANNTNHRFI